MIESQVDSLRNNGYVVVRNFIPTEEVATMREVAEDQLNSPDNMVEYEADLQYPGAPESKDAPGGRTIRRLKDAYMRHPIFSTWATGPEIKNWLRVYFGTDDLRLVRSHHNTIFTKHPTYGSLTDWHRDGRHWKFKCGDLVSAWFALGTEHMTNGGLLFIPNSHNMFINQERFTEDKFLRTDLEANRELLKGAVTTTLYAGDVVFFHCNTLHAAGQNHTDEIKFAAAFTYHTANNTPMPGTRSASMKEIPF